MSDSSEDERPAREEEVFLNSNSKSFRKPKQKIVDFSLYCRYEAIFKK